MQNEITFYQKEGNEQVWWIDKEGVVGEQAFTFDKKHIYHLFSDYPHKLSQEEIAIFDKEEPFWADFFKDRK